MKPFVIGIAGGTAAGKSLVCRRIAERIAQIVSETPTLRCDNGCECITVIRQESFYKDVDGNVYHNFDHPETFDFDLMLATLKRIRDGDSYEVSEYDYSSCCKLPPTVKRPAFIVLVEGILAFYEERIRSLFDMRIFVDCDADTRLASRVVRDVCERGRDLEQILKNYLDDVKPAFEQFVLPTKKYADVIIPRGAENEVAIGVIVQQIVDYLRHAHHESSGYHALSSNSGSESRMAQTLTTNGNGRSYTEKAVRPASQPNVIKTPHLHVRIEPNTRREDGITLEIVTTPPSAASTTRLAPTLTSPSVSPGKRARHTSESENANRRH